MVAGMNSAPPKILVDRVERVLEPGDDAEVAAAAADRPEQVGVLVLAGGQDAGRRR